MKRILVISALLCTLWLTVAAAPMKVIRPELKPAAGTAQITRKAAVKHPETKREDAGERNTKDSGISLIEYKNYVTDELERSRREDEGRSGGRGASDPGTGENNGGYSGSDTEEPESDIGGPEGTGEDIGYADSECDSSEPADSGYTQDLIEDGAEYAEAVPEQAEPDNQLIYAGDWTITFYCDCEQCCGQWAGLNTTASGNTPIPWYTVAAGYSYPFGTVLYIEGFGYFEVMDRGVSDGWADIFVNNHSEIPSYGMTTASVYIHG